MAPSTSIPTRLKAYLKRMFSTLRPKSAKREANIPKDPQHGVEQPQQANHQPISFTDRAAEAAQVSAVAPGKTLEIALENQSNSSNIYAYITGQALENNNALFLLRSDAKTACYPDSPSSTAQPLREDTAIHLGAPGNVVRATIPRIAGGRIWFSENAKLQFFLNPGPGLVEPSIFNQADPNINTNFAFCEFTFNSYELFINISYVDFVSKLPTALTIQDTDGKTQHVSGMKPNGLDQICDGLRAQTARDRRRWSSLIVQHNGQNLRAMSPNSAILLNPSWFRTYWTKYVDEVYARYTNEDLTVNTQAGFGNVKAKVNNNTLNFGNGGSFGKPSAKDIFGCSTGPFATGSNQETNVIIPRLAAAFNRSTLLLGNNQPNSAHPKQFYQDAVTNHYSRLVHEAQVDGHGYAFPYDDVSADGGVPQEGAINSGSPALLTVTVGGKNAYAA